MLSISAHTAAQLSQWYATFNCSCSTSSRLQRLFGSLGGGVSASKIRSTGAAATVLSVAQQEQHPLPDRVAQVMSGVLLERSLATPHTIMTIFGLEKRAIYCGCNAVGPNYNVASMMVWEESNCLRITCPECSLALATSNDTNKPVALPTFLRQHVQTPDALERELRSVYSALVSASGGCGRSVYQQCQPSTFRGSWTALVLVEDEAGNCGVDGEFLISNAVGCSLRLQQQCVCSDLLYAMAPLAARDPEAFALSPLCVRVIGGGEYLYCRYSIFRVGGKHDPSSPTASELFNQESCSKSLQHEVKQRLADNDQDRNNVCKQEEKKKRSRKRTCSSSFSLGSNVVNLRSVLQSALSKGAVQCDGDRLHEAVDAAVEGGGVHGDATELVLPPPQVDETNVADHLRKLRSQRIDVPFVWDGSMPIDVAKPSSVPYSPPVCNLVCPPIVKRTAFNTYRLVTNLGAFFDRIEMEVGQLKNPVALNDRTVHGEFMELLALIRNNHKDKSNVPTVDVSSTFGVPVSRSEINERQLCKSTILEMLAGIHN